MARSAEEQNRINREGIIRGAANSARKWPHGSRFHQEAMGRLFVAYRQAMKRSDNPELQKKAEGFVELKDLWAWVDGYLEMEEASHGETPLG